MSKLEPRFIQKELEANKLRPVYWIYGTERMKIRELTRRIEKLALGTQGKSEFNYEKLDGSTSSVSAVTDAFQSLSMMGGTKVIVVQAADELDGPDEWTTFLKCTENFDPTSPENIPSVVIFISKSFDSRKKWAKALEKEIAVVFCEEVQEFDREQWIDYLAKRRSLNVTAQEKALLRAMDPWSLEIIDQELSKMDLVRDDEKLREEVILSGVEVHARDEFIDALFSRDPKRALKWARHFGEDVDQHLPILGLVAWNMRHLKLMILEQITRSRSQEKRNPYLMKNLERWRKNWDIHSIQNFEEGLFEMDLSLKSKPLPGPALWTSLILENT